MAEGEGSGLAEELLEAQVKALLSVVKPGPNFCLASVNLLCARRFNVDILVVFEASVKKTF